MIPKRLSAAMVGMTFALSLFLLDSAAQAQVRRTITPDGTTAPPTEEATPQEPGEEPSTPPGEEEGRPEQEGRDPKEIAENVASRVEREGPKFLLEDPAIQEELKISEAQLARINMIDQVMDQRRDAMRDQMRQQGRGGPPGAGGQGGFRGGPGGGVDPRAMAMQMFAMMQQETQQALAQVLSKAQLERLEEIIIQAQGPFIVAKPEIQDRLYLQPTQRQKIALIIQEKDSKENQSRQSRGQLFNEAREAARASSGDDDRGRGRGDFQMTEELRTKMEELQAEAENSELEAVQRIGKVLTSRQITNYNKMKGRLFDFTKLTTAASGGRGGGRGR